MTNLRVEQIGDVHVLTLDDPTKRNAIGSELAAKIVDSVAALKGGRALVVRGEGSTFCAGADLPEVFGHERPTTEMRDALQTYYQCFLVIRALPFPTFAAVEGPAIGAGLNLALSCDIRIADPSAKFGATFTKIGLHPGGGCSHALASIVGREQALRILLRGATLTAGEAQAIGLISEVVAEPYARALELASEAAELEPWLARAVKKSVESSSFEDSLEFESWAQAESTHQPRFRDWIGRFASQPAEPSERRE